MLGIVNIHGGTPYAVPNNNMANGSLTIGDQNINYGNGNNWTTNTAGLMFECLDNTEIAVHDAGHRVVSLMSYQGGAHQIQIGRDMSWGKPANILLNATAITATGGIDIPTGQTYKIGGVAIGAGSSFDISTSLIGRVILNNSVDGGSSRGLMFWNSGDPNWGMYMASSGGGRSFSGGTACGGYGFSLHAIRIRTTNASSQGFIYEGNDEVCKFSVRGSDGLGWFRGNLRTEGQVECANIYNTGWFRNYNDTGLYNETHGCHFVRNDAQYGNWQIWGGAVNSWHGIRFQYQEISLMAGAVGDKTCGFHYNGIGWALRIDGNRNVWASAGTVYAGGFNCNGTGWFYNSVIDNRMYFNCSSSTTRRWEIVGENNSTYDLLFRSTGDGTNYTTRSRMSGSAGNGGYTNFTGIHHTRAKDKYLYDDKYIGYIVSSTKKYSSMNSIYKSNSIQRNLDKKNWDFLPIVELSSTSYDKKAFGVIAKVEDVESTTREEISGNIIHMYDKNEYDRRLHIAGTGEGGVWVCNYNSNLECGDYITTSPIAGIGMRQDDDIPHNYTVAKITMDCDFNPPLIPVQVLISSNHYITTSNYEVKNIENSILTSNLILGTSNYVVDTSNYSINTSNYNFITSNYTIPTSNLVIGTSNYIEYFKDDNGDYIYTDLIIDGCAIYEPEYEVRDVIDINTSNIYKMAFVGCVYNSS